MEKDYTPKTLEECYEWIDSNIEDIKDFIEAPESKALGVSHMSIGMWIRNNWGLWKEDSPLAMWFISHGIFHADDMSGVILTSYHRHKNGLDVKFDEQVKKYKDFWDNYDGGNPFEKEDNT